MKKLKKPILFNLNNYLYDKIYINQIFLFGRLAFFSSYVGLYEKYVVPLWRNPNQ